MSRTLACFCFFLMANAISSAAIVISTSVSSERWIENGMYSIFGPFSYLLSGGIAATGISGIPIVLGLVVLPFFTTILSVLFENTIWSIVSGFFWAISGFICGVAIWI